MSQRKQIKQCTNQISDALNQISQFLITVLVYGWCEYVL